jgi:hypothetical protein
VGQAADTPGAGGTAPGWWFKRGYRWRLLLDSRVVDVLRLSNLILVTLASLKPFFFNGLKKAWHFSDNVGAEAPGIQLERSRILEWLA